MKVKATKLLQIKLTPMQMRRLHALRNNYGITMKEMMTRVVDDTLARGVVPKRAE